MPIYSATRGSLGALVGDPFFYVKRQVAWVVLGTGAAAWLALRADYRQLLRLAPYLYAGNLVVLALVLVLGDSAGGARSWFRLGPLSFQPSELSKLVLILTLARHLADGWPCDTLGKLAKAGLHVAPLLALLLLQPDLGTALVFLGVLGAMVFLAGARPRHLLGAAAGGAAVAGLAVWLSLRGVVQVLKPYQLQRLLAFLSPGADPRGAGYNVIQSQIAIGSGQLAGRGLLEGSQTQLDFLPARHTDFIFSVVGEELGFVGAASLLAAYFFLLRRILRAGELARDRSGALIAGGVAAMLLVHLVINVGMATGLFPVTGLPLPFVSYGGSFLVTSLAGVGLVEGVYSRRRPINL